MLSLVLILWLIGVYFALRGCSINVCVCVTLRRGLDDVKVSCAGIHSDHSAGLSKTLQDYRYTATFTSSFNKDED